MRLDLSGLSWTRCDWIRLQWMKSNDIGLNEIRLNWIWLDWSILDFTWTNWIRLNFIGLGWIQCISNYFKKCCRNKLSGQSVWSVTHDQKGTIEQFALVLFVSSHSPYKPYERSHFVAARDNHVYEGEGMLYNDYEVRVGRKVCQQTCLCCPFLPL